MSWKAVAQDPAFLKLWEQQTGGAPAPKAYQHPNGLTAVVSRDEIAKDDLRWHISLRYGNPGIDGRVPTWEEMVSTAHELRPGVVFVVGIPPRSWWMNVHPDVLHMTESKDEALIASWRAEGQGHTPT